MDGSYDRAETARLNRQGNAADQTAATQARTGVDLTNASAGGGRGDGQAQLLAEQSRLGFTSNEGGAAFGNPNITAQGQRAGATQAALTTELGGQELLAPAITLPPTLTLGGLASNTDSFVKSLQDPNAPPYTGDDPIVRARLGLPPLPATPGATQLIVRDC